MPCSPKLPSLIVALLTSALGGTLHAQTTINANTAYTTQDYNGQVLTAGAADLGSTTIRFTNLSNTSWSASPTATPTFSNMSSQAFRQSNFTGANWSGVTFTSSASAGAQYFTNANFTNANFSGATFNLNTAGSTGYASPFETANFTGANFSNVYIDVGLQKDFFKNATFSSTTNFSGSTIIAGGGGSTTNSMVGVNFSNATLRILLNQTNLNNANFQNAVFVSSNGISSRLGSSANLTDFRGTDFLGIASSSDLSSLAFSAGMAPIYDANTKFVTQNGTFDPVARGWTLYTAPIPEPSTYALTCGGLFTVIAMMRRQPRHA